MSAKNALLFGSTRISQRDGRSPNSSQRLSLPIRTRWNARRATHHIDCLSKRDTENEKGKSLTATFMALFRVAPDVTLLQPITVDFATVQQGKELGKGAFATVYEAIYTPYREERRRREDREEGRQRKDDNEEMRKRNREVSTNTSIEGRERGMEENGKSNLMKKRAANAQLCVLSSQIESDCGTETSEAAEQQSRCAHVRFSRLCHRGVHMEVKRERRARQKQRQKERD